MTSAPMGSAGKYFIKKTGYHPEAGNAFLYRDSIYEIWFYVDLKSTGGEKGGYELIVKNASSERFAGGTPIIDAQDQKIIEENIREYFRTFDLFGRPITSSNPAPIVIFSWKLRP